MHIVQELSRPLDIGTTACLIPNSLHSPHYDYTIYGTFVDKR